MLNVCGPAAPGVAGVCGEDWGEKAVCCQIEIARKRTPPKWKDTDGETVGGNLLLQGVKNGSGQASAVAR